MLVGGLAYFLFSHILAIIIPIDFHIFERGSNHQPECVCTVVMYWFCWVDASVKLISCFFMWIHQQEMGIFHHRNYSDFTVNNGIWWIHNIELMSGFMFLCSSCLGWWFCFAVFLVVDEETSNLSMWYQCDVSTLSPIRSCKLVAITKHLMLSRTHIITIFQLVLVPLHTLVIWGFPKVGVPSIVGWFIRENPIEMDDDWGYPYFKKPPYIRRMCTWCDA